MSVLCWLLFSVIRHTVLNQNISTYCDPYITIIVTSYGSTQTSFLFLVYSSLKSSNSGVLYFQIFLSLERYLSLLCMVLSSKTYLMLAPGSPSAEYAYLKVKKFNLLSLLPVLLPYHMELIKFPLPGDISVLTTKLPVSMSFKQ